MSAVLIVERRAFPTRSSGLRRSAKEGAGYHVSELVFI
jgi:hypothetical protein